MASEKKKPRELSSYSSISRKDLETIAGEVHQMKDADRIKHTQAALRGHTESGVIDSEYNKISSELEFGKKAGAMQGLYGKLHDEHSKNKGDLDDKATTDWLRNFANTMMPAMQAGVEGYKEENYQHLMFYLKSFEQSTRQDIIGQIKSDIKKGKGFAATAKIIEAVSTVRRVNELNNFSDMLIPEDRYDLREAAFKKIADDANKTLKEKGITGYEVSPIKLASTASIGSIYLHYAKNDYDKIIQQGKVKAKKAA